MWDKVKCPVADNFQQFCTNFIDFIRSKQKYCEPSAGSIGRFTYLILLSSLSTSLETSFKKFIMPLIQACLFSRYLWETIR